AGCIRARGAATSWGGPGPGEETPFLCHFEFYLSLSCPEMLTFFTSQRAELERARSGGGGTSSSGAQPSLAHQEELMDLHHQLATAIVWAESAEHDARD